MSSDEGSDAEPSDTFPLDSLPPHPLSDSDDENTAGERQGVVSESINVDVTMQPVQLIFESSMEDETVDTDLLDRTTIMILQHRHHQPQEWPYSSGYSHTVKKTSAASTVWCCCVRNKQTPGLQPHLHAAQSGSGIVAEITSTVKRLAVDDVF